MDSDLLDARRMRREFGGGKMGKENLSTVSIKNGFASGHNFHDLDYLVT